MKRKWIGVDKHGIHFETYTEEPDPVPLARQTPAPAPVRKEPIMPQKTRSPIERGKDQLAILDDYFGRVEALRKEHPEYTDTELMAAVDAENPGRAAAAQYGVNDSDIQAYQEHAAALNIGGNPYRNEWDAAIEEQIRLHGGNENTATGALMRERPELFNAAFSEDPVLRFVHGADVELRSGRAQDLAGAYQLAKVKLPPEAAALDNSTLFL